MPSVSPTNGKLIGCGYYSPGYIAGVTNLIFESAGSWDLLCDIGNGRVVVHKDILSSWPVGPSPSAPPGPGSMMIRTGTIRGEAPSGIIGAGGSEEEVGRMSTQINAPLGGKSDFSGKADSSDNIFMEDVSLSK